MGQCYSKKLNALNYLEILDDHESLTQKYLIVEPIINPSEEYIEELGHIILRSFLGNEEQQSEPIWDWIVGKEYDNFNDPFKKDLFDYYSKYIITLTKLFGVIYIIKHKETKQIIGLSCMFPPEAGQVNTFCKNMKVTFELNSKAPNEAPDHIYGERISKRAQILQDKLNQIRAKYLDFPIWFMGAIAILPEYQGKGLGSIFINLMNQFCDMDQVVGYLECGGDQNMGFFKDKGYTVLKMQEIQEDLDEDYQQQDDVVHITHCQIAAMIRLPQKCQKKLQK